METSAWPGRARGAARRSALLAPAVWAAYALALVASMALIAGGAGIGGVDGHVQVRAAGYVGLLLVLTTLPLALILLARAQPGGAPEEVLRELERSVRALGEQAALSDEARRVLNRRRERQLLRDAIEEDIGIEDWDAAMILVKELAERFGYRADAEEFRQRIEQARFETVQRTVTHAIASLDSLIVQRRWDQALSAAARIGRLYPDSPRVEGLRHHVEHARQLYKEDLERRFLLAAQESRIDDAMELLRELDAYLTEAEGAPLREVARGVIGKARENLGAQFKLAVKDRRWHEAVAVGQQIIEQFPNSRMAHEVREMLDSLRARTAGTPG